MSGIAGIAESGMRNEVNQMLNIIDHRGPDGREILTTAGVTLGAVWAKTQKENVLKSEEQPAVMDCVAGGHVARAQVRNGKLELIRDQLGIAPLYYGQNENGSLCFASEVKALLEMTNDVHAIPPGHRYDGNNMRPHFPVREKSLITKGADEIAIGLKERLDDAVANFVKDYDEIGSWLSGGLDSSALTALACPYVDTIHTFAAGFPDAPDLENARSVADHIGSIHHEVILTFDDVLSVLPEVIYYLESFDALLVRSSITNYLVAQAASEYVPVVISGEGGDELFAGYAYLKSLDPTLLRDELIDITHQLHNTALQRVDRSASAHGTMVHLAFLDPKVVNYAFRIPSKFKLFNGIEKWILRKAMRKGNMLPKKVLNRKKSKFWKGTGLTDKLEKYAEERISNNEFRRERKLTNGWRLNTKEELMYYRIFRKYFRNLTNLSWMGRTKRAPIRQYMGANTRLN